MTENEPDTFIGGFLVSYMPLAGADLRFFIFARASRHIGGHWQPVRDTARPIFVDRAKTAASSVHGQLKKPILSTKIKNSSAHHGGAWKVA